MLTTSERYEYVAEFALFLRKHAAPMCSDPHLADVAAKVWAQAKALHNRYEAECNYQWADTDKYRKATENIERKLANTIAEISAHKIMTGDKAGQHEIGLLVEFQRDPRGWPVTVKAAFYPEGNAQPQIIIGG